MLYILFGPMFWERLVDQGKLVNSLLSLCYFGVAFTTEKTDIESFLLPFSFVTFSHNGAVSYLLCISESQL